MIIIKKYKNINDIYILLIWCAFIFLCTITLRSYNISSKPPFWDNLIYQNEALQILRDWLSADWKSVVEGISNSKNPAHVLILGFSFLLIGMNSIAPYVMSALVGFGCLVALYLLSIELGASKRVAFWGALIFSITPNFMYQNFLQTRNDFELALFLTLAWVLFLKGIKNNNRKFMIYAGLIAGLGALFKASAPAYFIFGVSVFIIFPEKYISVKFKNRLILSIYFFIGVALSCGWHYLPNISKNFEYYKSWSKASEWKESQYYLQSNYSDFLYYPKNIIESHVGLTLSSIIGLLILILSIRKYYIRTDREVFFETKKEKALFILTIFTGILPLVFISTTRSFASVGDIPVLPILAASISVIVYKLSSEIYVKKYTLIVVLSINFLISFPSIPIVEREFFANDLNIFSDEITKFRKQYGLNEDKILQVYGHPLYNIETYKWFLLINPNHKESIPGYDDITKIIFPEKPYLIADKILEYPMIIISEHSGSVIGGEYFHTFNRLHDEINVALYKKNEFIELKKIILEGGRFPISFALNKNYKKITPLSLTADHWVEWGGEFDYFSNKPSKIIWSGMTIKPIEEFTLQEEGNQGLIINFRLKGFTDKGIPQYESQYIPALLKMRRFKLLPIKSNMLEVASDTDPRKLAFYNIEVSIQ